MTITNKREAMVLFLGDLFAIAVSLWLALFLRYGSVPSRGLFEDHLLPFSIIAIFWVMVFFIAGLYEKHTIFLKNRLPSIVLNAQVINSIIAVIFFYFFPYFKINPKTNLFLYLIVSSGMILLWRLYVAYNIGFRTREKALIVGNSVDTKELLEEVNNNPKYSVYFTDVLDTNKISPDSIAGVMNGKIMSEKITTVVLDMDNSNIQPVLPSLYNLIFSGVKFIDMHRLYEDIFDRVPVSMLGHKWLLDNATKEVHSGYDLLKDFMDTYISLILGILSLIFYPFVYLAIKLDDGGEIFSRQERVGKGNKNIKILKFRTMSIANDNANWGAVKNKVTRVGVFLRKTRIDELPQLWNVLMGDISLIGPRPEFEKAVKEYVEKVPYYNVRHLIKPGLSGWAQIHHERHPHHGLDVEETRNKLSYDLYYIKNRSFLLDLNIALKTLKTLLSRSGV